MRRIDYTFKELLKLGTRKSKKIFIYLYNKEEGHEYTI